MTVTSSTARASYSGNGSQTVFPVPFRFLSDTHLRVVLIAADGTETEWALNTDYTVTGAGASAGGDLTALVAPAAGTTLVILRNIPLTQDTDYVDNDDLPAETLEGDFDKTVMILQQFNERLERVVQFPETDAVGATLPNAATRAGKYLGFDSNGEPVAVDDPSDIVISPFGEQVVNAADAEAAMDLIGPGRTITAGDGLTGGGTLGADRTLALSMSFIGAMMRGHIGGLTLSNNTSDANNDVDIAAGSATAGDGSTVHVLASGITRQLDATFGTGNGGLSSSLSKAASTTYHAILCRTSGGTVTVGFDTSPVGANLVADHGVTGPRRIGAVITNGSGNIRAFTQVGDEFLITDTVLDVNNGSQTTTASLHSLTVPAGIKVRAKVAVTIARSADTTIVIITSPDMTDLTPGSTTGNVGTHSASASTTQAYGELTVRTNTSRQIRARAFNGTTTLNIRTLGWIDPRGKFD